MPDDPETVRRRLRITLAAEPVSVPAARRFLTDGLASWGLEDLLDDASLCLSELAANAALHSASAFMRVEVARLDDAVRVSVEDDGAVPTQAVVPRPSFPDDGAVIALDQEATTGRGLAIVSILASAWGVERTAGGKRVWFEVTAAMPEHGVRAPTVDDEHGSEPAGPQESLPAGWARVRLAGCPVGLSLRQDEHLDELVRELQLAGADGAGPASQVLAKELSDLLSGPAHARHMGRRVAQQAAAVGLEVVDVEMAMPREQCAEVVTLDRAVKAADVHCRERRMLTLASSEDLRLLRAWMTEEIVRQAVEGAAPVPWSDWLARQQD